MSCRGFVQFLLKVINFLFALVGFAMIGYGIYMVVSYESSLTVSPPPPPPPSPPPPASPPPPSPPPPSSPPPPPSPPPPSPPPPPPSSSSSSPPPPPPSPPPPSSPPPPPPPPSPPPPPPSSPPPPSPPPPSPPPPSPPPPPPSDDNSSEYEYLDRNVDILQLRRSLFQKPTNSQLFSISFLSSLPTQWFLYLFIIIGAVIIFITCSGYIAAATTNGCCLSCYSVLMGIVMIFEFALAAFIFFYSSWEDLIPNDSTGRLESIEDFIENNRKISMWVGVGIVILQAIAILLSVILRALGSNTRKDYDSDDEYVLTRASQQPLLNRKTTNTNPNVTDSRAPRTDAWSARMREKYGLDTTDFSYNPAGTRLNRQTTVPNERNCCSIM